jgi:hypothetical protein
VTDDHGRSPGQPEPFRPEFRDPSSAWRWWGFLLIVLGGAGLMFHQVWDIPVLSTWEGKVAVGAFALGILLILIGFVRKR